VRVGCGGCLTGVIVLGLLLGAGMCVWGTSRALQDPTIPVAATTTEEDAARAQQKLFRLFRGAREPVVLSEPELNAFLSRNVDVRDWPFEQSRVSLKDGGLVEISGSVPLRRLVAESPVPFVAELLPSEWLTRSVWLRVGSHATFEREPRSQLRLDVQRLTVGRQRVPTVALRMLFDPASLRFVRVSLPDSVADVRIETGRAVIRSAPSRGRT
jgi:hypothetical protein